MNAATKNLRTVKKEELLAEIAAIPDGASIYIQTTVHDVGRALSYTAGTDPDDRRDPSEVVLALEGPLAYDMKTGEYFLFAGYLPMRAFETQAGESESDDRVSTRNETPGK